MAETAPLVVQTAFTILEETLGPGVARYREGMERYVQWRKSLNDLLKNYDDRIAEVTGNTDEEIAAKVEAIKKERDVAYEHLVGKNPPPPNPNDDPTITDADRRTYHLLINKLLERAKTDMANIEVISKKMMDREQANYDSYIQTIDNEVARKEAADRHAAHDQRRRNHRAKNWATAGRVVGTVLSAIPLVVTQVIGAVVSAGTEVAKAVYDVDTARRYAHALRNNCNWLLYEQPRVIDELERAESNLNYATALVSIAEPLRDSILMRQAITDEKLRLGIWDELALAEAKKPKTMVVLKWAAIAIVGLVLVRRIFK
jgi:hypothetical protein